MQSCPFHENNPSCDLKAFSLFFTPTLHHRYSHHHYTATDGQHEEKMTAATEWRPRGQCEFLLLFSKNIFKWNASLFSLKNLLLVPWIISFIMLYCIIIVDFIIENKFPGISFPLAGFQKPGNTWNFLMHHVFFPLKLLFTRPIYRLRILFIIMSSGKCQYFINKIDAADF